MLKQLYLIPLLLTTFVTTSCADAEKATFNDTTQTLQQPIYQPQTVGEVRLSMTDVLFRLNHINFCFGHGGLLDAGGSAVIIKPNRALDLIETAGWDPKNDQTIANYLHMLNTYPNALAVEVEYVDPSTLKQEHYIYIPDLQVAADGILIDISEPLPGQTCLECEGWEGRDGPYLGCMCNHVRKKHCGAPPTMPSCPTGNVCDTCSSPESPSYNFGETICKTSTPFIDTNSFNTTLPGTFL